MPVGMVEFMVSTVDMRLRRSSATPIAASMLMILIVAEAVTARETALSLVIARAIAADSVNE